MATEDESKLPTPVALKLPPRVVTASLTVTATGLLPRSMAPPWVLMPVTVPSPPPTA